MKVVEVPRYGGTEVLQVVEKPNPTAGAGQAVIAVKASGINFADLMAREGKYPSAPQPPFVLGYEVAGMVSEVGSGVENIRTGQRVMALVQWAGYADYAVVKAEDIIPLPDTLDFAPATALLVQGLTAYFLLDAAMFAPGKSVLVNAAAGGVGSLAVQIAKLRGAGVVVGTASTDEKREMVKGLGANEAADYTAKGWAETVKAATGGKGVDIFLDATGDLVGEGSSALADGGYWMIYGSQSGKDAGLPVGRVMEMLGKSQYLGGFTLFAYAGDAQKMQSALGDLIGWAVSGKLKIVADDRFPLTEAAKAHAAIINRETTGKVVLEP